MKAIVRFRLWRWVVACAVPSLAFGQVEIPRPDHVDNHRLPALEAADFMQSSLTLYPGSPRVALQLEQSGVERRLWPLSISRSIRALHAGQNVASLSGGLSTGSGTRGDIRPVPDSAAADDIQLLDRGWLNGRMRTQRLAVNGRTFYFLLTTRKHVTRHPSPSRAGRAGDGFRSYDLVAVEEGTDTPAAMFTTEGEPPVIHENAAPRSVASFEGPGEFAAVPWEDGIAVIYRDRGGIFARRFNAAGDAPKFEGERWRVAGAPDTIARYQLLARADASGTVHLLWATAAADGRETLRYCRLTPQTVNDCPRPVELSRSVAVSERLYPVNLMLQGGNVYVSWTDTRYAGGVWTTRNYAKLFVAASHDGGRTFGKPLVLNDPRDNADQARYAVTLPAPGGGVLAFWVAQSMPGAGLWQRHRFRAGWVDADLKRFRVGTTTVAGEYLNDVIERGVLRYHEALGH